MEAAPGTEGRARAGRVGVAVGCTARPVRAGRACWLGMAPPYRLLLPCQPVPPRKFPPARAGGTRCRRRGERGRRQPRTPPRCRGTVSRRRWLAARAASGACRHKWPHRSADYSCGRCGLPAGMAETPPPRPPPLVRAAHSPPPPHPPPRRPAVRGSRTRRRPHRRATLLPPVRPAPATRARSPTPSRRAAPPRCRPRSVPHGQQRAPRAAARPTGGARSPHRRGGTRGRRCPPPPRPVRPCASLPTVSTATRTHPLPLGRAEGRQACGAAAAAALRRGHSRRATPPTRQRCGAAAGARGGTAPPSPLPYPPVAVTPRPVAIREPAARHHSRSPPPAASPSWTDGVCDAVAGARWRPARRGAAARGTPRSRLGGVVTAAQGGGAWRRDRRRAGESSQRQRRIASWGKVKRRGGRGAPVAEGAPLFHDVLLLVYLDVPSRTSHNSPPTGPQRRVPTAPSHECLGGRQRPARARHARNATHLVPLQPVGPPTVLRPVGGGQRAADAAATTRSSPPWFCDTRHPLRVCAATCRPAS